jgi:hypothetical protein
MTMLEEKVELPRISGSSTINHQVRVELGLNCSEYVLMDYIYQKVQKKEEMNVLATYVRLGLTDEEQTRLLKSLVHKGFVLPIEESPPVITDKWISSFKDLETEFNEHFWKLDGRTFWTGSKKKAKEWYIKLRKKYSKEFLTGQRDHYAKMLHYCHLEGFNRDVMMAERWLNPKNEYYLSDWESEWKKKEPALISRRLVKKPVESTKTLTDKERKEQYAKDNQQ